jgi:hydroxyacylglutathione hydrolase
MPIYYENSDMRVYKTSCGPYDNNSYIVLCLNTQESLIIDAPMDPAAVLEEAEGTKVKAIIITHNHKDHLYGLEEMVSVTKAPVGVHSADTANFLSPPDFFIEDGDSIKVGNIEIKAIHTPGHTDGSTCFTVGNYLFSGDTLFPGGPGRSKSPEALASIIKSITDKLFTYPDQIEVLPGHGITTKLGESKRDYKIFVSKEHPNDLSGDVTWLGN